MRLIDADSLRIDFKKRVENCDKWIEQCAGEELKQARAIATKGFLFEVIMTIDLAPTVTIPLAELDTTNDFAEWIDVNGDGSIMKCSKCGEEVCCKDNNFCPNCGARLRGDEK